MSKLTTIRNNATGAIVVKGKTFVVTIHEDGYVTIFFPERADVEMVRSMPMEERQRLIDGRAANQAR